VIIINIIIKDVVSEFVIKYEQVLNKTSAVLRSCPLLWFHWSCDSIGHLCCGGRGYCCYSGLWLHIQKRRIDFCNIC